MVCIYFLDELILYNLYYYYAIRRLDVWSQTYFVSHRPTSYILPPSIYI